MNFEFPSKIKVADGVSQQGERADSSVCANNTKRRSKFVLLLGTTSQCFVVLNERLGRTHDGVQIFGRKLFNIMDHVNNLKHNISKFALPSRLIDPETRLEKQGPMLAYEP